MTPTSAPTRQASAVDDPRVVRATEEYAELLRNGAQTDRSAFLARHAEIADALAACLDGLEFLHAAGGDISGAAGRMNGDGTDLLRSGVPLGDYQLIRELGRGGMGIVYEAEQLSLGRRVALKVLPLASTMDAKQLQRFKNEARAAASLHHEHIVPVYGVGCERGVHFYAMQLIEGKSLAVLVRQLRGVPASCGGGGSQSPKGDSFHRSHQSQDSVRSKVPQFSGDATASYSGMPQSTEEVAALGTQPSQKGRSHCRSIAEMIAQAADALEHAHSLGIVHRDVKPGNLILDNAGQVWVTDFGLARFGSDAELTMTGDLLGTLRYMSPEQALARHGLVDHRTDVYSLGATLYELLTKRPAMDGVDKQEILKRIAFDEPVAPRKLDKSIPAELEVVTLKALAKEPAERYATAGDFADDLRKFLADEPIRARRVTPWERGWRWCRRHPAVASLAAVVVLLLFGVTVASLLAATHFERIAASEREARQGQNRTLTDMYTWFGLTAGERDDPRQAILWFANAARIAGDDHERADANRTRAAAWGRQTIRPVRAFVHPADWIENNMVFHPDGRHLLTHGYHLATDETDCRLWDLEREAAEPFPGNPDVVSAAAWDAMGERLAVGTPQGEVTIYRFSSGELLHRVDFADRITRVLFSPDGRYCAVAAARQVRVWDCRQAAFVTPELEHPKQITTLAFHPQGELLATGCKDNNCRVFAVPGGTQLIAPVRHLVGIRDNGVTPPPPVFLEEGRALLTRAEVMSRRDLRTGEVLRVPMFGGEVDAITVRADGKYMVVGEGIYDVATAQPVCPELKIPTRTNFHSAAFSPDGLMLLSGSSDRTARLWSAPDGKPLTGPLTHHTTVSAVAFAPDGRHLATAQRDGLIRLWALPAGNPRDYRVPVGSYSFVRISRDGRFLLPTGLSFRECELRSTTVFDVATGRPAGPPLEADGIILDAAFSPDGLQVATAVSREASVDKRKNQPGQQPGQVHLWDWRVGKLQHEPVPLPSEPRKLDYSPDGRQLAVICAKGELVVIDPATGKTLRQWQVHHPQLINRRYVNNGAIRFSPDSRTLLAFGTETNSVGVWNAVTERRRYELPREGNCSDVQFSPDGRLFATAGMVNQVCVVSVRELATGEKLASIDHPGVASSAHFSPDGRHLLTGCSDGMARLWDWRSRRLVCPPFEKTGVAAVAFTPDGRHVLCADGALKIWEWRTGKPLCPPLALGGTGYSLAVTPDGKRVAVGGLMKEIRVFHLDDWLAPSPLEPDDLCLWGEIVSGQRVEDSGGVTNLSAEEWLQRWRGFHARHPDFPRD